MLLKLPGKVQNFLWRVSRNVLPSASALVGKHVDMSTLCCWCHMYVEDTFHVLFVCGYAQAVWQDLRLQHLLDIRPGDVVFDILKHIFDTGSIEEGVMVGLFCWSLWTRRNKWLWNKVNMSVFGLKAMTFRMITDLRRATEVTTAPGQQVQAHRSWVKPPSGWIKINVDAACNPGETIAGVGCVARDDSGRFIRARSNIVHGRLQPREAEALGLKEALSWVKEWRASKCVFESDAKLLVDAVQGRRGLSYFDTIAEDCNELLKHFAEVLLVFIHRSANQVAHL